MEREDRLSRLLDHIVEFGSVRVEEAAERFSVSTPTVRRDLDELAHQQLVVRTRGGAKVNSTSGDVPLRFRTSHRWRQKNLIARAVPDLIEAGSAIGFNGGTTTTAAAYELGVRSAADERFAGRETTVVTNAVNIANDLIVRRQLRVVVLGGVARERSYELIGPLTSLFFPEITIDTLFLGASAIDLERGLYTHDEGEAAINAALVRLARRTVVVADSSKFAESAFARIATFDHIDSLVTDSDISDAAVDRLRDEGVDVIVAE